MNISEISISARDNPEEDRFEIEVNGEVGFAQYRLTHNTITFTHTEVPYALRDHGLGRELVRNGLKAARERGLKVKPACPLFADYIQKHAETSDLVHSSYRRVLGLEE